MSPGRLGVALLLGLAGPLACDNDFVKGWQVDRTRVLGARVEGARVEWLVARAARTEWAYAICTDTRLISPRCDTPVAAAGAGASDGELVSMEIGLLPPSSLVLAVFCETGAATLSPVDFAGACADGSEPLLAAAKTPAAPNANPPAPSVVLDGQPIGPDTCVAPGSKHSFGFVFEDAAREPGEALLASTTVTAGELDRQYTSLEPSEATPRHASVEWTAPSSGSTSFYLVLRDGRGGAAFTRAAICTR